MIEMHNPLREPLKLTVCIALIFLNYSPTNAVKPFLRITHSGYIPPRIFDVSLRFYMTIRNMGATVVKRVEAKSEACCLQEKGEQGVTDCESMRLQGDQAFSVKPHHAINLTLIYPNMYVYDRVGSCEIIVNGENTDGKSVTKEHVLNFDTIVTTSLLMPNLIQALIVGFRSCSSIDEDRRNYCKPVSCVLKYAGTKNYYNNITKRCEPTVACVPNPHHRLPDKVLKQGSNACKDLNIKLGPAELKQMEKNFKSTPMFMGEDLSLKDLYPYSCVHGKEAPGGTGCDCDPGWETMDVDRDNFNSAKSVHYMCNVRDINSFVGVKSKQSTIIIVVLGIMCCLLILSVVGLPLYLRWTANKRKANEKLLQNELVSMTDLSQKNLNAIQVARMTDGDYDAEERCQRVEFESARVHTPNMPLLEGELELRIGDIITNLKKTTRLGIWKGTCNGIRGIFPVSCAELYRPGTAQWGTKVYPK